MSLMNLGITLPRRVAVSMTLVLLVLVAMLKGFAQPTGGGGWEWLLDLAAATGGGFLIRYGFRQLRKKNLRITWPASHHPQLHAATARHAACWRAASRSSSVPLPREPA